MKRNSNISSSRKKKKLNKGTEGVWCCRPLLVWILEHKSMLIQTVPSNKIIHGLFLSIERPHPNRDSDFLLPNFGPTRRGWQIPLHLRQRRCHRRRCSRHRTPPLISADQSSISKSILQHFISKRKQLRQKKNDYK